MTPSIGLTSLSDVGEHRSDSDADNLIHHILEMPEGNFEEEEREEVWDEREEISAGNGLAPWLEISEGNSVDYHIQMVDGARPKLRIEDSSGRTVREHTVAEVIDDEFTAPEDDRYYFYIENTATFTSGTWDYRFERVNEVPIATTADLTIEREYEEEFEVCE